MNQTSRDKEFLGQGLAFPIHLDASGQVKLVSGIDDIDQAIKIVLGTAPGERLMRPEFGCRVHELLFAPHDLATEGLIVHYVREALARWEPRIAVQEVRVSQAQSFEGALLVEINYETKSTHDQRSIVYPFFLMGSEA